MDALTPAAALKVPGIHIAILGSCEQTVSTLSIKEQMNYKINLAMKCLYREGYRRFRAVPLPRTGDPIKYKVMGWPD